MIKEANRPRPKGTSSKTLKECLEKNYSKIVSEDLYVEIQYFQRGKDALEWKRRRILAERGVTEGIIVTPIPEVALSSTEWTCRWLDGTITVAIVEDNLKNFTQEDKKPIEGLSFHVLGHIEDMN